MSDGSCSDDSDMGSPPSSPEGVADLSLTEVLGDFAALKHNQNALAAAQHFGYASATTTTTTITTTTSSPIFGMTRTTPGIVVTSSAIVNTRAAAPQVPRTQDPRKPLKKTTLGTDKASAQSSQGISAKSVTIKGAARTQQPKKGATHAKTLPAELAAQAVADVHEIALPQWKGAAPGGPFQNPQLSWQTVPKKSRSTVKRRAVYTETTQKKGKANEPGSNRFAFLAQDPNEDDMDCEGNNIDPAEVEDSNDQIAPAKPIQRPRPITLSNVNNVAAMEATLLTKIPSDGFEFRTAISGDLRIYASNSDNHRAITRLLSEHNIAYTHFCLKEDRSFRIVIRNLASSTTQTQIHAELAKLGHTVVNIYNPPVRGFRKPNEDSQEAPIRKQNIWFVNLKQAPNNKDALEITKLGRQRVSVDKKHDGNRLRQCFRCFEFDHTKNYCLKQPTCGRCGENHWTGSDSCTAKTLADLCCANCGDNHAAYDRKCPVFAAKLKKIAPKIPTLIL